MTRSHKCFFATLVWVVLCSGLVFAAPLAVTNSSFEDNDPFSLSGQAWADGVPNGWVSADGTPGSFDPMTAGTNGRLFVEDIASIGSFGGDGLNYLGVRNTATGYVYQDLGVPWQINTTYTVDVQVSRRGAQNRTGKFGLWDSATVSAGVRGTDVGIPGTVDTSQFSIADEFFAVSSLTPAEGLVSSFTTGATVPSGNVVVFLENTGAAGNMIYDAVTVDASPAVGPPTASPLEVTIDRDTGAISVTTPSSSLAANVFSNLTISSGVGALNTASLTPIAGNYDSAGDSSVSTDAFTVNTLSANLLDESTTGSGSIAAGQVVSLGNGWRPYPTEDVTVSYQSGANVLDASVNFVGNGGVALIRGDFNGDGAVDGLDWPTVRDNFNTATSGSLVENYYLGDLDNNGIVGLDDLREFEILFETLNGAGSFAAMVPEPGSLALLGLGSLLLFSARRRSAAALLVLGFAIALPQDSLQAAPLAVQNHDFEAAAVDFAAGGATWSNCLDNLCDSTTTVDTEIWQDLGPDGSQALNNNQSFTEVIGGFVADGTVHLGVASGSQVQQTLSGTPLQPNTVYTLTTGVGRRDAGFTGANNETRFGLAVGGTNVSELQAISVGNFIDSTFEDRDYVYITGPTVPAGDIEIVLGSTGTGRGHFDNVRLDATPFASWTNTSLLSLEVDPATGATSLVNGPGFSAADIDYYEVRSASGAINLAGWSSLEDQDYEGGGAPGLGNGWEELNPSSAMAAEFYLAGSSPLAGGASVSLGNLFNPSGTQDLQLLYKLETGETFSGPVTYGTVSGLPCDYVGATGCDIDDIDALYAGTNGAPAPLTDANIAQWLSDASSATNPLKANSADQYVYGDVDLDGDVNSIDLGLLLNNFNDATGLGWGSGNLNADATVNSLDLGLLLNNFNFTSASVAAVPEPNSMALMLAAMLGMVGLVRRTK